MRNDAERIRRIETDDAVVFDEHERRFVVRARRAEEVVEADFQWSRFEFAVPIGVAVAAETVVPFAHRGRAVANGFQQRRQRDLALVEVE